MDEKPPLSREELRTIAIYQKGILFCILGYIVLVALQLALPPELRLIVGLVMVAVSLSATAFVFLLATKVYSTVLGIVLGLLALIPLVGLVLLLIINGKATSILKGHGIYVGLMGAKLSDIR